MITKNTVLILGAGASKPYGFPLGPELRDEVLKASLQEKEELSNLLTQFNLTKEEYYGFANDLKLSGFSSVDAFLENREKWLNIGKILIAHKLIMYEERARLFPPNQPKDHWYECLWQKMLTSSWEKFKNNKLTIITFNYDRSLEHYLGRIICNNFQIRKETAIRRLPIIHVHGDLGPFTSYGKYSAENVKKAADSIKIVHESDNSSDEFIKADTILKEASSILFVGFGYNPQNMQKLSMFSKWHNQQSSLLVTGTHKGIRDAQWTRICEYYGFSMYAKGKCGGSISEFLSEWLQ